jgi:putative nucleotidyltransferase with HDIG domain
MQVVTRVFFLLGLFFSNLASANYYAWLSSSFACYEFADSGHPVRQVVSAHCKDKKDSKTEHAENAIRQVFAVFNGAQHAAYFGEPVSQLDHALQAAYLAEEDEADRKLIIASLFHDIGHLLASESDQKMDGFGALKHHKIGSDFLRYLGFGEEVATLVERHVDAKRYRVKKDPSYAQLLSEASLETLRFQGGPMSDEEVIEFEMNPLHPLILKLRSYDEKAKVQGLTVPGLQYYKEMIRLHLMTVSSGS